MHKLNSRLLLATLLGTALLTACGGGDSAAETPAPAPAQVVTVTAVAGYIKNLFTSAGESSTPVDTSLLILAEDNSAEPEAVN
jgi:ABC-type glycerol-3-phosphate transport system substrate-binding protein